MDGAYAVVDVADSYLHDLRFGGDAAEGTTRVYAGNLATYLDWLILSGRNLEQGAADLSRFMLFLQMTPVTRRGRGQGARRDDKRINHILGTVRELYKDLVSKKAVTSDVLALLYRVADDRNLPAELRAEDGALRCRAAPRHQLKTTEGDVSPATAEEWEAMLLAA